MRAKATPFYIGRTTAVAGETIAFPAGFPYHEFSRMTVIVDVKAITGAGATMTFAVQEAFSRVSATDNLQMAVSAALSATGTTVIPHDTTGAAASGFPGLGLGGTKQIVTTPGGTVATFTADIWAVPFN